MTNITISLKELETRIKKKIPLEQLEHQISMMGIGVEGISGDVVTLDISPNRPDLLSNYNFFRFASNFILNTKPKLEYLKIKSEYKVIVDQSLKNIRPYTSCAIIADVSFDDEAISSLINLQEKLHTTLCRNRKKAAIGVYPMDAIEFPVYFKALDAESIKFTALDGKDEQSAFEIIKSTDAGKAYGYLLEGLSKYPVFIDSKGDILSMPPVINSEKTGRVSTGTKNIFIEVSGFDLSFTSFVLNIIVSSILEKGGRLFGVNIDYKTKKYTFPDFSIKKNKLDTKYAQRLLGVNLKEQEIKKALNKMGHEYKNGFVYTPSWRADILHQIDLVEEIAIGYGYENFKEEIPNIATIGQEDAFSVFCDKISYLLVGYNLFEVNTLELSGYDNLTKKMNLQEEPISLKNSISEKYNKLRNFLLPSLMEVFSNNIHNDYPQKIFEIGEVFTKEGEKTRLCIALLDAKASFTDIKQISGSLFSSLDIEEKYQDLDHPSFIEGRCAKITIGRKEVGFLGEISPYVLEAWGLTYPVCAMEIYLKELFSLV